MKSKISLNNIWKNKWIFLSGFASICLFGVSPSITFAVFGVCSMLVLILWSATRDISSCRMDTYNFSSITLSIMIDCFLVFRFISIWSPSSKVAALASVVSLSAKAFLLILGLLSGVIAFNFILFLDSNIIKKAEQAWGINLSLDVNIIRDYQTCINNLKSNWYIPVSALAFFCLESQISAAYDNTVYQAYFDGYFVGIVIACICIVFITSQMGNIISVFKGEPFALKVYSGLSAMGICLAGNRAFFNIYTSSSKLGQRPHGTQTVCALSLLCAVVGLLFAYLITITILSYVRRTISASKVFKRVSWLEWIVFSICFVLLIGLTVFSFSKSQAFYGTDYGYDVIYTSDSPALLKNNADLWLSFAENDLRQPLFAVFAAPFTGAMFFLASLVDKVLGISGGLFYTLVDAIQIALMLSATILLIDICCAGSVSCHIIDV